MASSRPSAFKGAGFFNGDGQIVGYKFTDEWNGRPFEPGINSVTKKPNFHWLYVDLGVKFDGATAPVTKSFKVGNADEWLIEDDGHTVVAADGDEGRGLSRTSEWALLIDTLCKAGFPEDKLPDDKINYEAIIGYRARFGARKNERMAAQGKKQLNKKTGREYEYRDVVVEQVYGPAAIAGKPASTKSASKVNGSGNTVNVEELADSTLLRIITDNNGSVLKTKLSMASLKALQNDPNREAVRKLYASDAYLARQSGWEYDKVTGLVALA